MNLIKPIYATLDNTGTLPDSGYNILNTIDGSGLSTYPVSVPPEGFTIGGDLAGQASWVAAYASDVTGSITYDLGSNYIIDKMFVWNFHSGSASLWGIKDVSLEYSVNNVNFTYVGFHTFAKAPDGGVQPAQEIDISDGVARYVKINILSSHLGGERAGLNEIRFSGTPVPEPGSLSLILGIGICALSRRRTVLRRA